MAKSKNRPRANEGKPTQPVDNYNSLAKKAQAKGFTITPVKGKVPFLNGWQNGGTLDIDQVTPDATGFGVVTGFNSIYGLDVDCLTVNVAEAMLKYLQKQFGITPIRYGLRPKFLMPFLREGIHKKEVSTTYYDVDTDTGESLKNQIEILGKGQQFVLCGIHPDTEQPYEWEGGEITGALPTLTDSDLSAVISHLDNLCVDMESGAENTAVAVNIGGKHVREEEHYYEASIDRAVRGIEEAKDGERNDVLNAKCYSILKYVKSGLLPESSTVARLIDAGVNCGLDIEEVQRTVNSALSAAVTLNVIEPRDLLLERYIYLSGANKYLDTTTGIPIEGKALDRVHATAFGKKSASKAFDMSHKKRVASNLGWLPVDDEIIHLNGVPLANTYRPITVEPIEGDVSEWLSLCDFIYSDLVDYVLDHLAYSIQYPLSKIRWQILVIGSPRTGKSMTVRPVVKIWGSAAVSIDPTEMANNWGDMYAGRKFVVMEEVYQPNDKGAFNRLKPLLANDDVMRLNIKGKGQLSQQNLFSMVLFTNEHDALQMDEDDDKLLVVQAPSSKWGTAERYTELANAINEGDMSNKVYHYLLNRDVSAFSYGRIPIRTEAAKGMARASLPAYQEALIEMIESEAEVFKRDTVTVDSVMRWLESNGYKPYAAGVTSVLKKRGFIRMRGERRVDGDRKLTPSFWTKCLTGKESPGAIYDWYDDVDRHAPIVPYNGL